MNHTPIALSCAALAWRRRATAQLALAWLPALGVLSWPAAGCLPTDSGSSGSATRRPVRSSAGPKLASPAAPQTHARGASRLSASSAPPSNAASRLDAVFFDDFERSALGANYSTTSSAWRIEGGRVCARGAHNQPLWLNRALPINARIEFDATSASAEGDLKVEAWGDGRSGATTRSYSNATSYLFIFGGWRNTVHVLARLDEHGPDRSELLVDPASDDPRQAAVEPGRLYHWVIERADGRTVWFGIDGLELLSFVDAQPLTGKGHEHFAFNDWETPVCFDNLRVRPLP